MNVSNFKKYVSGLCIGFLFCWCLFYTNFSSFYSFLLNRITYKGLTYFSLFLSSYIICVIFYDLFIGFISEKNKIKAFIIKWIITFACFILCCFVLKKRVYNWQYFLINMLNLLLYVFAWYSLLKAFKVWKNYGSFYKLFLEGKIIKIVFVLLVLLFITNIACFSINKKYFENSFGLLVMSLLFLFIVCFALSSLFYYCKSLRKKIEEFNRITEGRVKNNDRPKEVSIVYDQLSLITLLAIISKRVFDTTKEVDFPFVFSKVFKIFCYSISLITTCFYDKRIKKVVYTLSGLSIILIFLLVCSKSLVLRSFFSCNDVNKTINFIIDYFFLPFGTIKVIIQILTIIVAKRATSISTDYFKIAAFFSIVTSLNLIAKEKFFDNTITMSLFKCFLYIMVIVVADIFNRRNKEY